MTPIRTARLVPLLALLCALTPSTTLAAELLVPSRLLHRMQDNLLATGTFIQTVDLENLGPIDRPVFERNFINAVSAQCDTTVTQGQRIRISNGQATIHIYNRVSGDLSGNTGLRSDELFAVAAGGAQVLDSNSTTDSFNIEVFKLDRTTPAQPITVAAQSDTLPEPVPTASSRDLFEDSMSLSNLAATCLPSGPNAVDSRTNGTALPQNEQIEVTRVDPSSRVTLLPYASLPLITTRIDLFYSPSDIVVEISSLMLVFVDLWFLNEIKPPKPVRASTLATVLLVMFTAIAVASVNIFTISQTHVRSLQSWVGCGTWQMVRVQDGFMGAYVCQLVSIQRTVAWYAYLLYIVPGVVLVIVSSVTVYTLYVRYRYGVDKSRRQRGAVTRGLDLKPSAGPGGDPERESSGDYPELGASAGGKFGL